MIKVNIAYVAQVLRRLSFIFLPIYHRNNEIPAQNMVGREGFEPSNPAMSRRYLNQLDHRPRALRQHKNFVPLTVNAISF